MTFRPTGKLNFGALKERPLPPTGQLLGNFLRAVKRNVESVAGGAPIKTDEATSLRRRAVCVENSCGFYRSSDDRCAHTQCGCWLQAKRWLHAEKCPDGKW